MTNVLFTSAGRRGYLLDWFRESNFFGQVFAINSEPCTAFADADAWRVIPTTIDESYRSALWSAIEEWSIGLVIPLTDVDSLVLSSLREEFLRRGVTFFGSEEAKTRFMVDKSTWTSALAEAGFPVPKTFRTLVEAQDCLASGEVSFPLCVKPGFGTSARLVQKVGSLLELEDTYGTFEKTPFTDLEKLCGVEPSRRFIIQEVVEGIEIGVDLLADFSGRYEGALFREKRHSRGGETDQAKVRRSLDVGFSLESLAQHLGFAGLIDLDLVLDGDGRGVILDINPRIGGGYPFSHLAGANLPTYARAWIEGRRAEILPEQFTESLYGKVVQVIEIPLPD